MNCESYLRYLLADEVSLMKYYREGKHVSLNDVKRSLLLRVRALGYSVPDHYYRMGTESSFEGIDELSQLFTVGLVRLADEYLEMHEKKVYVQGAKMNDWQLLLPLIPPLLLNSVKIWKEYGPDREPMDAFARLYLLPSLSHSAIPSAYLPEMEASRKENSGFDDLHIHLNGSVETDLAWHDFLRHPEVVYREIEEAFQRDNRVKEQLEQLTNLSNPTELLDLFCIAGRLRDWLFHKVMSAYPKGTLPAFPKDSPESGSFEYFLNWLYSQRIPCKEHPLKPILGENACPLILEGMLYIKVFDYLAVHPADAATAGAFHYYLLILGFCNKLLVQQTDTFGFEQFQKYTSNRFREFSERSYQQRFLQLAGNELLHIRHIEGRFSPKDTMEGNLSIIGKIVKGFDCLNREQEMRRVRPSTMSLVAHFIKKPDDDKGNIRFETLRHEVDRKGDALIALLNTHCTLANKVKGVDAAASELDTPPEVFAPCFHKLRKNGIRHFTFHAGEDFFHVLSGLRAVYEAMDFLDLQAGDRIGHATATGIDVKLWRKNIGERILISLEEYMDDLVFAYHLISIAKERTLEVLIPRIALRIEEYASEIYPKTYSINELVKAWRLRKEDPAALDEKSLGRESQICLYYHSREGRKKGRRIISVDAYDIFGEKELTEMQKILLRLMQDKQIVIETLPTSNVMIGHHHNFSSYHLYNWYKWSKEGKKVPAIVVGTDDAGIFATNIYNEYCHIYCLLVFDNGLSPYEAMTYIDRLVHNAEVYVFT